MSRNTSVFTNNIIMQHRELVAYMPTGFCCCIHNKIL